MALGSFDSDNRSEAELNLSAMNFGPYPMSNGLTRLQTRFLGDDAALETAVAARGTPQRAEEALAMGLVTIALDDIDWEDEIRIFVEERASFSADALTAMEANLRFAGPETLETKIFGRLTAWQNWVFQRPNAVGKDGALSRYGTGRQPNFQTERI
jgi:benzoyl-CoA-dihydrodiol lyase